MGTPPEHTVGLDKPPTCSAPHAPSGCPKRSRGLGNDDLDTDEEIRPRLLGGVFVGATVERVFHGATDEWYDIACRTAGRNMTLAEWEEIGPRDAEYQATCPQFPLEDASGS